MSTISSASIFLSRSSSNRFVAASKESAMEALASPTNFPKETFSSGESEPKDRDAPEIEDLSPV